MQKPPVVRLSSLNPMTALDRGFADAHAGLADALLILYNFGLRPPDEIIPRAKQAVNRALQLNPNLSDAYSALALIQFLSERDWQAAENLCKGN